MKMRLSKFLTTLGLITGLVSANIIEIPSIKVTNNATAITIPNFSPSANFRNGTLTVEIPTALIQAGLSETLRANEGEIKSTEFNKIFLSNMRATLVNGGIRVSGNWKFHHRERLGRNPFTGRTTHTPWVIVEGTFYQDFNLSVANGQLRASTNGRPDVSSSAWYGVIVDEIIHHMQVRQNVKDQLDAQLSSFNGLNLQRMLIDYGANTTANQLGVNQNQVSSFINSNVGRINANFNSSRLAISLSIPSLQTPPSQPVASPSQGRVGTLVKLRNKNWGTCLNLQSAGNGVTTNSWECVPHPDQEWKIEPVGNGFVKLRNKNWGTCLNLQSAGNGVTTNSWECVPHPDQEWKIEPVG